MRSPDHLGPWVRRFLLEHLVAERHPADNTQRSYRDTLALLIPWLATTRHLTIDRLLVDHVTGEAVRQFLAHLEETRGCSIATRNQRLAALHSFVRFVGARSPEHVAWCADICRIPFKRGTRDLVHYLEQAEIDALLAAPGRDTRQGFRDYALLLFLYNSGARASEAIAVNVGDLDLSPSHPASVRLMGKGAKVRRCPLWSSTAGVLQTLIGTRPADAAVFVNRRGQRFTRFGVHDLVTRYGRAVARRVPSLTHKRLSPHTIRHTTATHLLRAGVDINTIRAWLGHVSVDTTNIYAEIDLEMKAKALATCAIHPDAGRPIWKDKPDLLAFLRSL